MGPRSTREFVRGRGVRAAEYAEYAEYPSPDNRFNASRPRDQPLGQIEVRDFGRFLARSVGMRQRYRGRPQAGLKTRPADAAASSSRSATSRMPRRRAQSAAVLPAVFFADG